MNTILLANQGFKADRKALQYACNLSQEMKANLSILEIIPFNKPKNNLEKLKNNLKKIRMFLEDRMVNITYAESLSLEDYKKIIYQEVKSINSNLPNKNLIKPEIYIQQGSLIKEIKNFVNKHRDVLMTILPVYAFKLNHKGLCQLKKELDIPLVLIK
ncbi:hypothetical protein SAMN04488516_1016 [Desulfonauticus submarinus]|uniref:Universal stress protein family protein n=1 Tax=Desulfonauticus submarinus TaxID=206665 RepID=A0A1G9ZFD2_9BACT|nr:hypothetical protein [Desulfonauticus submarinus]SDN20120.1 hypothetical protein SAMN04488516_1016 [Desulfonauticus submarinus]